MLTRNAYFGLNLLSLVGLIATGLGLSLARRSPGRRAFGIGLMVAGTALIFAGFFVGGTPP